MAIEKFIIAPDNHGDKIDPGAERVFFGFLEHWKPKHRIHAGDNFDFRPLRRRACDEEKRESMATDFRAGVKFLTRFKPTVYLRGNHCERLWDLAKLDRGIESDYAITGCQEIEKLTAQLKCEMRPYHKREGVYQLGHLKVLHGFACGVNAARQTALVYGACVFGHVHTIDEHSIPGLERRVARSIGCLGQLDMEYNSRQPGSLRHAHGFAYGITNTKTGLYHLWQAEQIGDCWVLPTDTKEYR